MSGAIASAIAPWFLAQFVINPLSRVVVVLSGQEAKLLWDILCLVSLGGVFFFARRTGLAPLPAIRLLSAVYTLLIAAYYLVLRLIVVRFAKSGGVALQTA
jgi:hypothetical protein